MVGSLESSTTRRASARSTLRSTRGLTSTRCRKSLRVRTKKRSGVFVVTVAIRGVSSSSAISPKKSPLPRAATRLPFLVISTWPSTITKNSRPASPSLQSTVPAGTSTSSLTFASCTSSARESPSKSGALLSAWTFVSWLNSRTPLPYSRAVVEASGEQMPVARHALELVCAPVLEVDARARGEVPHDARDEHLAGAGLVGDPGADVHGDSLHLAVDQLDLARVDAGSQVEPDVGDR